MDTTGGASLLCPWVRAGPTLDVDGVEPPSAEEGPVTPCLKAVPACFHTGLCVQNCVSHAQE